MSERNQVGKGMSERASERVGDLIRVGFLDEEGEAVVERRVGRCLLDERAGQHAAHQTVARQVVVPPLDVVPVLNVPEELPN